MTWRVHFLSRHPGLTYFSRSQGKDAKIKSTVNQSDRTGQTDGQKYNVDSLAEVTSNSEDLEC